METTERPDISHILSAAAAAGGGGGRDMASGSGYSGGEDEGSSALPPAASMPVRLRGLHDGSLPPPFLINLYKMVDDKETDAIISWGLTRTSFILRDEKRFISEVLPRFSKSSRFNSFVTQLNNYGFKKLTWNHREYGNEWFQKGKQHLLKNIKSRSQLIKVVTGQENTEKSCEVLVGELQTMFEKAKWGQEEMKKKMAGFKEHVQCTLSELHRIVMDTACELVSNFADAESEIGKKRKFECISIASDAIEKDFQSICEKFELLDNTTENCPDGVLVMNRSKDYMALMELIENPMDLCFYHNGNVKRRSKQPVCLPSSSEHVSPARNRGGRVPPFLHKLYEMVEKEETDSLISWRLPSRTSFVIWDHNKFSTDILPMYFNHSNFGSFNSQLNIYGFRKVRWECHEYANEWFRGGRIDLLENIKSRQQIRQQVGSMTMRSSTEIETLRNDLKKMLQKQETQKIQFCIYKQEIESSLSAFKETVFSMANIVKGMIQKHEHSHGKTENPKKIQLNATEGVEINLTDGAGYDLNALAHTHNADAQAYFTDLNLEELNKLMEVEDTRMLEYEVQSEMENHLSLCS